MIVNLTHGIFVIAGAYGALLLYRELGLDPLLAVIPVGAVLFAVGYLYQRTIIHSLLHLFEMPAARRKVALDRVREDLRAMENSEAQEKAIVAAAALTPMKEPGDA